MVETEITSPPSAMVDDGSGGTAGKTAANVSRVTPASKEENHIKVEEQAEAVDEAVAEGDQEMDQDISEDTIHPDDAAGGPRLPSTPPIRTHQYPYQAHMSPSSRSVPVSRHSHDHHPDSPTTPRSPPSPGSVGSSPALASPSGLMSLSMSKRRRAPPSFPSSPRQGFDSPVSASHLRLSHASQQAPLSHQSSSPSSSSPSFRSRLGVPSLPHQPASPGYQQSHPHQHHTTLPGISSLLSPRYPYHPQRTPTSASAPLRTPVLLRVPSTPIASPAFNRSGYGYPHPRRGGNIGLMARSPHSPYFHRGVSAGSPLPRMPLSASAPPGSHPKRPRDVQSDVRNEQTELRKVSQAWVVKSLQQNAPRVWYSPETTDCRVVVPIWSALASRKKARAEAEAKRREQLSKEKSQPPHSREEDDSAIKVESEEEGEDTPTKPEPDSGDHRPRPVHTESASSIHSNQPGRTYWPPTPDDVARVQQVSQANAEAGGVAKGKEDVVSSHVVKRGRRGSLPERDQIPVLVFPLHKDYLITQSKLFRRLLSSTSTHLDLPIPDHEATSSSSQPGLMSRCVSDTGPAPTPRSPRPQGDDDTSAPEIKYKGAKLLPTPPGEPVAIYIPMPDPGAFGVLVHWLYWGDQKAVELALSKGIIDWQGLVHNIDYLDLGDDIKRIVGKWWRKWVKTESQASSRGSASAAGLADDDEEDDERPDVDEAQESDAEGEDDIEAEGGPGKDVDMGEGKRSKRNSEGKKRGLGRGVEDDDDVDMGKIKTEIDDGVVSAFGNL